MFDTSKIYIFIFWCVFSVLSSPYSGKSFKVDLDIHVFKGHPRMFMMKTGIFREALTKSMTASKTHIYSPMTG